jgi:hypothetical protein
MRRRWKLILGVLILAVGVGQLPFLFLPPRDRVSADSYDQLTEGMTEAQVEKLFARPPDTSERQKGSFTYIDRSTLKTLVGHYDCCQEWVGPAATIRVYFKEELLTHWEGDSMLVGEDSLFDRIKRALGLQ